MFELTSDNKNLNRFFTYLKQELKENNTSLVLSLSDVYIDSSRVSGYYCSYSNQIVVKLEEDFLETLVHEFCHYLQFKNNKRVTRNVDQHISLMWRWLNKEIELHESIIKHSIHQVQRLELDCERMSVVLIKKYKMDISLERYVKNANLYIYFHNYVLRNREWFKPGVGLDSFKTLYKMMPIDLKGDKTNMPETWYKEFDKYF